MKSEKLKDILKDIRKVKVAVCGDFCLDAYWVIRPGGSEFSAETGLLGEAVEDQYYSLGGASNIVANLAVLNPRRIEVIGVIGNDIFGREMKRQFEDLRINTEYLLIQKKNFSTVVFGKRILEEKEKARIDFGFFNKRSVEIDDILLEGLSHALRSNDVLIFNQQVPGSITNRSFLDKINKLFAENTDKIIISDSRHYGGYINNTYIKTNIGEVIDLFNFRFNEEKKDPKNLRIITEKLYKFSKKPIFVTCGHDGISVFDSEGLYNAPGVNICTDIDTVGAGDTVTSAIALGLGAGKDNRSIIEFANLAAAVSIQKLFKTGSASEDEIIEINKKIYYEHD